MIAAIHNTAEPGWGLLAEGYGFLVFLLLFVAISAVADWIKKKGQKESTDNFDPGGFASRKPKNTRSDREAKPLSTWEEEIRRMLQGEPSPPPVPPPQPRRQAPPPLPVYQDDPMSYETEGRVDAPLPTHLSSMERPDTVFKRAAHIEERVHTRMVNAGNHSDSDAAFARIDRIDDDIAARMASAGSIHIGQSGNPTAGKKPATREDIEALVKAIRSPVHARGAIIASVIMGPPKAFEY